MQILQKTTGLALASVILIAGAAGSSHAQATQEYGTENLLGTGTYSSSPKAGATLYGLSAGTITDATGTYGHGYPFAPAAGDYPGTDQIYVGTTQTAFHDGYSQYSGRIHGPQVISLDYSALIPAGQQVKTLTLGIASDDFQNPVFRNPFSATLNGEASPILTSKLNSLMETTPLTHFFTFGVDPALLTSSNILTLGINEGGDGGDGWAVDFLTVGVTTKPAAMPAVPEASTTISLGLLLALGAGAVTIGARRRKASAAA